jgi:hypothetical protein
MSSQKAQETTKKIENIEQIAVPAPVQNTPTIENPVQKENPVIFISPVNIEITPKNTAAPTGYTSMIHTVTE